MADLKKTVADAMRLGPSSRVALSEEIDRNIRTARAEMIRSGVSDILANSNHELIEDAIVTFCMMKMGDSSRMEKYEEGWMYQLDCIRKSSIKTSESEEAAERSNDVQ